ncbi:MAG: hypothetical protein SWK76_01155 [Actinomycetota bacterium]|nr:hypothetical protein [Actinomycetota bacterium]
MKYRIIVINAVDNVAMVLEDLSRGERMRLPGGGEVKAAVDIPFSHKIA